MTLNPTPDYPSAGRYVLKLHRDVTQQGRLFGRIEHVVGGDSIDFVSGDALLRWLLAHASGLQQASASDPI